MTKYAGRAPYPFTPGDNMTGQCSSCGGVFFGETAFDAHWRGDSGDRYCIDPASGPVDRKGKPEPWWLDDRDRWHYGRRMSEEDKARRRATTDAARVARINLRAGANPPPRAGAGVSGTPRPAGRPETRESEGAA